MNITVNLEAKTYDIVIERGAMKHLADFIDLNRKVLVISDDGVPKEHIDTVLSQCKQGYSHIVKQGEGAKSFSVFQELCEVLLQYNFGRKDLVIAVGGGVIGDLAGFVASSYMRGISFVNIPTTTLSQIDSSIGGKVAINLNHVKNIIGTFYHPDVVIVDSDTLSTLPIRHYNNGLVEAIKAGLIYDEKLFELMETTDIYEHVDEIIYRCLLVKKSIVEQDEKEQSLRKILNFGHTIGHAIETVYGLSELYHGECVAIGMIPMLEDEDLKNRTLAIYKKLSIQATAAYDKKQVMDIMCKDKKTHGSMITIIKVKTLGKAELHDIEMLELESYL